MFRHAPFLCYTFLMKKIHEVKFHTGSKEELLPGFTTEFPYISSRAELDKFPGQITPWHWHRALEIFYIEKGTLEYSTPHQTLLFPAGSGGITNSNVLHMSRLAAGSGENVQFVHLFDTSFLAGEAGSLIEQKYFTPVTTDSYFEMLPLFPENSEQKELLGKIRDSFLLPDSAFGYEMKIRERLSEIWLALLEQIQPLLSDNHSPNKNNAKLKSMMVYIHEHYGEKITIPELAASAYLSERECFRVFQEYLHTTPAEYMRDYRLQIACQILAKDSLPITEIAIACGLGNSSYFGKVFREQLHCTPSEYRHHWQDFTI